MSIESRIANILTPYNYTDCNDVGRIKYIVLHYTANPDASAYANAKYYASTYVGASAHYFCDWTDTIYRGVADDDIAWHVGASHYKHPYCRNANSIGIEMCCHKTDKSHIDAYDQDWYFDDQTINNAVELTKYLMAKYNVPIENVLRHYDVTGKYCLPVDDTELLTKHGWVNLGDIKVGDIVAQYVPETDGIEFVPVQDVVEPRIEKTLCCRSLEATPDHRMYAKPNCQNSPKFKCLTYGDMLDGNKQYLVKNAGFYSGKGLDLTDDELRMIAWVQGDGSYLFDWKNRNIPGSGVRFHMRKARKAERLTDLLKRLNIEYYNYTRKNDDIDIVIKSRDFYFWCEKYLDNKVFRFDLLEMTKEQFDVFWEELLYIDGNVEDNLYCSTIKQNLDVVQALCALNGVRSNNCTIGGKEKIALIVSESNYSIGGTKKRVTERETVVSCVTVPSGYILIRQHGKTFIVGNCPTMWVQNPRLWEAFKARLTASPVDVKPSPSDGKKPADEAPTTSYGIPVKYQVFTNTWYPNVISLNDYAGVENRPITAIYANTVGKASEVGRLHYRVHILGNPKDDWLPWVIDREDYAGIKGRQIDCVQFFLEGVAGREARYRVSPVGKTSYYPWVIGMEDYAGVYGIPIDKLQVEVV